MLSSKRERRQSPVQESFKSSRMNLANEDDQKYQFRGQMIDNVNARLAANFNQITELLIQRKALIMAKIKKMFEDHENRVQAIARGRMQDLKNEARMLRDDVLTRLVQNSDKLANNKALLRRIVEQHNFTQFENMEKIKGKKYFDRLKEVDNDINNAIRRHDLLAGEYEKASQKQRSLFAQIEQLEAQMVAVLRRKEGDYLKRADQIQVQIQKRKSILKNNKESKDKKKKDVQIVLRGLMDTLNKHESTTIDRSADIDNLFGGNPDYSDFQQFLRQFENVIDSKQDQRKDQKQQRAIAQLMKLANGYDVYVQQLNRERQNENIFIEEFADGLRGKIKTCIIEKVYFQEISSDKNRLIEILKKQLFQKYRCRAYLNLLAQFQGQKGKILKELDKASQMKSVFLPKLKNLLSHQSRKEELRRQLDQLLGYQAQLERNHRRLRQSQQKNNGYLMARATLERQMEQEAQRGNLGEYKAKLKELQKMDKDQELLRDSFTISQLRAQEAQVNAEIQAMHARYADLICQFIVEQEPLSFGAFLGKLSKRLDLL